MLTCFISVSPHSFVKLARRWHVHGSSLLTDLRPVLTQLIDAHRSNLQDHAHWTSESLQRTMVSLSSWVVIPADHFPSRAHVICPLLFAILMHKTFCSGEVFSLCRESAASFRSEVVTTLPPLLQQRYAWGLRLQAPLPTARILPKPTKDWQKALTVFALIFELIKVTFPDIPGQLSVQELVQELWDALSQAEPTEYIHLVSQDLSGFFTSILTERFHQALQVLLHRYDQVVGLRRSSQWSVYDVACSNKNGAVKLRFLEPFVNKTFDASLTLSLITVTLRLMAICSGRNVVLLWDHLRHPHSAIWLPRSRTSSGTKLCSLRFRMPDFGVIWHERYVDNRFILLRDSAPHTHPYL